MGYITQLEKITLHILFAHSYIIYYILEKVSWDIFLELPIGIFCRRFGCIEILCYNFINTWRDVFFFGLRAEIMWAPFAYKIGCARLEYMGMVIMEACKGKMHSLTSQG